jgi:hypothetical protein
VGGEGYVSFFGVDLAFWWSDLGYQAFKIAWYGLSRLVFLFYLACKAWTTRREKEGSKVAQAATGWKWMA